MYWRERRLRPGLYTDGQAVYESSYRYSDGRNGMYRKSTLQQYLDSNQVPEKQRTIYMSFKRPCTVDYFYGELASDNDSSIVHGSDWLDTTETD